VDSRITKETAIVTTKTTTAAARTTVVIAAQKLSQVERLKKNTAKRARVSIQTPGKCAEQFTAHLLVYIGIRSTPS